VISGESPPVTGNPGPVMLPPDSLGVQAGNAVSDRAIYRAIFWRLLSSGADQEAGAAAFAWVILPRLNSAQSTSENSEKQVQYKTRPEDTL